MKREFAAMCHAALLMSVLAPPYAAPARAQQAPAEEAPQQEEQATKPAKSKKPPAKPTAAAKHTVSVINGHDSALAILSVTPPGASESETVVLLRGLAAKAKATAALPGKGCVFDVYGRFEDESTIGYSKLDLCKDRSINIVH